MEEREQVPGQSPLNLLMVKPALATPFSYDRENALISGCIYEDNGKLVDLSLRVSGVGGDRVRNKDPHLLPNPYAAEIHIEEPCIYLGHLMGHYGHFITETISTFWALPNWQFSRVAFHKFLFGSQLKDFMTPFFESHGVLTTDIYMIDRPTRFSNLLVPQRTFSINSFSHLQHAETARRVRDHVVRSQKGELTQRRRIFLSRTRLPKDERSVSNARDIELIFREFGFDIIHPQELSIDEQIGLYAGATVLAGYSGSALHNCLFLSPNSLVIELADLRSPTKPLSTQVLCNQAAQLTGAFIEFTRAQGGPSNVCDTARVKAELENILGDFDVDALH
ncbi:glycosyltransferase family 61 protein [Methylobacterium fujisawaense]